MQTERPFRVTLALESSLSAAPMHDSGYQPQPTSRIYSEDRAKALGCHRVRRSNRFPHSPMPPAGMHKLPAYAFLLLLTWLLPLSLGAGTSSSWKPLQPPRRCSCPAPMPGPQPCHTTLHFTASTDPHCWTVVALTAAPPASVLICRMEPIPGSPLSDLFIEAHPGQGPATSMTTPWLNTLQVFILDQSNTCTKSTSPTCFIKARSKILSHSLAPMATIFNL